jgi:hypothetical protein
MTADAPEQPGRVPVGELRELVDEWRENGMPIHSQNPHPGETAGEKAARELAEVLDRYD